jgi:hypothetical protein
MTPIGITIYVLMQINSLRIILICVNFNHVKRLPWNERKESQTHLAFNHCATVANDANEINRYCMVPDPG